MKRYIKLLLLLLIGFCANAQTPVPAGFPAPKSTSWYDVGWLQGDSGIINAKRDTTFRARFSGTQIMWQHNGVDTNVWYNDGNKYFRYLRTGADVIGALGYTPLANITAYIQPGANVTFGGLGTSGSPYVINAVGGGGSGNLVSINTLTSANQFMVVGSTGSDFNIVSVGSTHTFNIPTGSASVRGLISTTDWANFNSKQAALNGTGFVKMTGTTVSYDNSTYYLASNPSSYISRTGISALPPVLYNNSTGVISGDTTPGLTHFATQAYVLANGGVGSGITGAGNLVPLFSTSIAANTLNFTLNNATAHRFYGNFTGSTGVPSFSSPSLTGGDFFNQGTTTTVLIGNAAGNLSFGAVNLTSMVSGTLPPGNGGTGINTYTVGDMLYASASGTLSQLADVAVNNVMISGGVGTAPQWGKVTLASLATITSSTLIGNPTGSAATPQTIGLGFGIKFDISGNLAVDTAAFKDTIYLRNLGAIGDSLAYALPGGTLGIRRINFSGATVTHNSDSSLTVVYGASGGLSLQKITSGSTGTVTSSNSVYLIDPASTLSTYIATLPASPVDMQIVIFHFGGSLLSGNVINSFSVVPNSGQTIVDNTPVTFVSVTPDNTAEYRWIATNSKWYRFKP